MRITMACRCWKTRTILFLSDKGGQYRLPVMEMCQSEGQGAAFSRFIQEHFGLNPEVFDPTFRTLGRENSLPPSHFVFCSVQEPVHPLYGYGTLPFKWVARSELQDMERFVLETQRILSTPVVQGILFDFQRAAAPDVF